MITAFCFESSNWNSLIFEAKKVVMAFSSSSISGSSLCHGCYNRPSKILLSMLSSSKCERVFNLPSMVPSLLNAHNYVFCEPTPSVLLESAIQRSPPLLSFHQDMVFPEGLCDSSQSDPQHPVPSWESLLQELPTNSFIYLAYLCQAALSPSKLQGKSLECILQSTLQSLDMYTFCI